MQIGDTLAESDVGDKRVPGTQSSQFPISKWLDAKYGQQEPVAAQCTASAGPWRPRGLLRDWAQDRRRRLRGSYLSNT